MKIGIMTFWWSEDNYGQLLQCYALQKYLRDQGHDPFLIRYRWEKDVKAGPMEKLLQVFSFNKLFIFLRRCLRLYLLKRENEKHQRFFGNFRKNYLKQSEMIYETYDELKKNPPVADVYLVGSDQVWRFNDRPLNRDKKKLHAYFLDFGSEKIKRISYAASWGTPFIQDEFIEEIAPLLKKFVYVSVREKTGLALCCRCGVTNAEWVPDPTFLLHPKIYRELYAENSVRKLEKPFLLLYMLKNDCDFDIEKVYEFASSKNLEVVYVTGNGVLSKRCRYFATIPEWLYLIDNAQYIITNSFHACVFSFLFGKQFCVIPLCGDYLGMNSRFDSFFELTQIQERFIKNYDFSVLDQCYKIKPFTCQKLKIEDLFYE